MDQKMRICFVTPEYALNPPFGGIATSTRITARWLAAHKYEVHVVCLTQEGPGGDEEDNGVHVHFVAPQRIRPRRVLAYLSRLPRFDMLYEAYCGWSLLENSLGAWLEVRRLERNGRFDVIECADYEGMAFWGLWPIRRSPLLLRGHGILALIPAPTWPGARFHEALERFCAQNASFILNCSRYLTRVYQAEFGVSTDRMESLPSPIDIPPLRGYDRSQTDRLHAPTILYVGRFEHRKGSDTLFVALNQVHKMLDGVRAILIGSAVEEFRAPLEAFLSENKGWVSYLGPVSQEVVFQHMANADMLVFPSRRENLPRTLLEALAIGLPQVATRVDGNPEIVEDGVTGLLVEPDSPNALAGAILDLCSSAERRAEMARNSREKAVEFEISHVMPKYDRLLRALARGDSPKRALVETA